MVDLQREKEWLEAEVKLASTLTDQDRIRTQRDLLRTADDLRRTKTPEELERDDEIRSLEKAAGHANYLAWVERSRRKSSTDALPESDQPGQGPASR